MERDDNDPKTVFGPPEGSPGCGPGVDQAPNTCRIAARLACALRACPRHAPELPSTASDHRQQQPAVMRLTRGSSPRATHGNALVLRSSETVPTVCWRMAERPVRWR